MSCAGRGGWSGAAQAAQASSLAAPPGPDPLAYPVETVISNLQPAHGFTKGSLGTMADDAANFVRGSQSLRITTDGAGGVVTVTKSAITPALDLTGRYLRLWLKVDDLAKLSELSLYLSSDNLTAAWWIFDVGAAGSGQTYRFLENGKWSLLTIGWGQGAATGAPLRNAVNAVRLRAKDKGGGQPATVWFGGIASVPQAADGVVTIGFDDGWASQFTEARKKMDQYGFPGTAYVIPNAVGTPGYMTLAQIRELQDLHGWSIGGHHETALDQFSGDALDETVAGVKEYLLRNGLNRGADHFAYPNGVFSDAIVDVVRRYFRTGRTIVTGPSEATPYLESVPPAHPYKVRCINVRDVTPTATLNSLMTRARDHKEWLILNFHKIVAATAEVTDYSITNFAVVIDNIAAAGVKVRTVREVLGG